MPDHSIHGAPTTVCLHSMWCEVQVCRGPGGERLKRAEWKALGRGKLSVDYEPRNEYIPNPYEKFRFFATAAFAY